MSKNTTTEITGATLTEFEKEFGLKIKVEGTMYTQKDIAEKYGKEHYNVIAKIESFIKLIPELNDLNFKAVDYIVRPATLLKAL